MTTEKKPLPPEIEVHRRNLYFIAQKVVHTREFESDDFRVRLPREGAALETLSYADAESLLVKANDNYTQLQTYLAQSTAAKSFFKRAVEMKEKLLEGSPQLLEEVGSRNPAARQYRVATDEDYQKLAADQRTAEVVVSYLERLSAASVETLQVVKKLRDAALARRERQSGQ